MDQASPSKSKCFWDGIEVPEAEYLRRKFCLCGALNAPNRLMCKRCISVLKAHLPKTRHAG